MCFRTFVYWMTQFICLYIVNNPRLDPININSVCSLWRQCEEEHFVVLHIKLKWLKCFFIAFRKLLSQQHRLSVSWFRGIKQTKISITTYQLFLFLLSKAVQFPGLCFLFCPVAPGQSFPGEISGEGQGSDTFLSSGHRLWWERREYSFGTSQPWAVSLTVKPKYSWPRWHCLVYNTQVSSTLAGFNCWTA